ncbi:MAG: GNAT family N-acetyltransferase [Bdellovibrionales bacterium]
MDYEIVPFEIEFIEDIIRFTDIQIGKSYFTPEDLEKLHEYSIVNGINCSYVALHQGEIVGVRLTYAPGTNWPVLFRQNDLHFSKIKIDPLKIGYFKSLFIGKEHRGKGFGGTLSKRSIESMLQLNAKGVLAHSWKESPSDSSRKYLLKLGFKPIAEHKLFWSHLDYKCIRCGNPPCQCTAIEMFLQLSDS